jgi:hypothetical protein
MTFKRVSRGDPITIPAATWNAVLDVTEEVKARPGVKNVYTDDETRGTTVVIRNDTGADRALGDCVDLGDPLTSPAADVDQFGARAWFEGKTPSATDMGGAVLAEPIPAGEYGLAFVSGVVSARVSVLTSTDWLRRCDLGTNHVMSLKPNGSHQVLWFESGTGTKWATVRLGVPQDVCVACVPDGNVAAGGSGTVSVYQNGSDTNLNLSPVYLDWMHNDEGITAGKQCIAKWFACEKRWRFIGAECEA